MNHAVKKNHFQKNENSATIVPDGMMLIPIAEYMLFRKAFLELQQIVNPLFGLIDCRQGSKGAGMNDDVMNDNDPKLRVLREDIDALAAAMRARKNIKPPTIPSGLASAQTTCANDNDPKLKVLREDIDALAAAYACAVD